MTCSTKRDSTNTGKKRKSTYSEHSLYWYYCYLIDEVKNIYIYIYKTKKAFLKFCNTIKDKNIQTLVETNRNLDKQEVHLLCGRTLLLLVVLCPEG